MIDAKAIRTLAGLGLSDEQMQQVLDIIASYADADSRRRAEQKERKARWRMAKKLASMSRDCPVTDDEKKGSPSSLPVPPKERSPIPPKEITPLTPPELPLQSPQPKAENQYAGALARDEKPERTKLATRLPADWLPDLDDRLFASDNALSEQEISDEINKFRDYWHSKAGADARKVDWRATWRNWIRRYRRPAGGGPGQPSGRGPSGAMDDFRKTADILKNRG